MKIEKKELSALEVAHILQVHRETVYVWKRNGKFVPDKIEKNGRWWYSKKQLEEFIDKKEIRINELTPDPWESCPLSIALAMRCYLPAIFAALKILTPRQRQIFELRLGIDREAPLLFGAIGDELTMTRERARQIEIKAWRRLKYHIDDLLRLK